MNMYCICICRFRTFCIMMMTMLFSPSHTHTRAYISFKYIWAFIYYIQAKNINSCLSLRMRPRGAFENIINSYGYTPEYLKYIRMSTQYAICLIYILSAHIIYIYIWSLLIMLWMFVGSAWKLSAFGGALRAHTYSMIIIRKTPYDSIPLPCGKSGPSSYHLHRISACFLVFGEYVCVCVGVGTFSISTGPR